MIFSVSNSNALINGKPLVGGGGGGVIGGRFDSSHRAVVGTFDRLNSLSSNISLTFSCYFNNPQMPLGGTFQQKLSAQFKCPAYARPPPSPPPPRQHLNIDKCITAIQSNKLIILNCVARNKVI